MDIHRTTVDNFFTGQGQATETPTPIVAPGHAPQQIYKGVTIKSLTGSVSVSGYPLAMGEEVTIQTATPSQIFIFGSSGSTYAWIAQ
jgi:hypothetical protein